MSEDTLTYSNDKNPYRIMLVDDSSMVRSFLKKLLEGEEILIVAEAENGKEAIEKVQDANPDVILLDIEMPEMDGITALPELLHASPHARIIMVSTLTKANAAIGIKALARGASDYIEKPSSDVDKQQFKENLIRKVKALGKSSRQSIRGSRRVDGVYNPTIEKTTQETKVDTPAYNDILQNQPEEVREVIKEDIKIPKEIDALAIGSSTGGPQALLVLFNALGNKINNIPIFITQHMPPTFTTFLAESIRKSSGVDCVEGADGMVVQPGKVYLAPGDYHMVIENASGQKIIRLNQNPPENFCRPSVNPMLRSLVETYGKKICVVILTGMGSDGLEGVREVSEKGGQIIIQDEQTSIVWGMPGAIARENLHDSMHPLDEIPSKILEICKGN